MPELIWPWPWQRNRRSPKTSGATRATPGFDMPGGIGPQPREISPGDSRFLPDHSCSNDSQVGRARPMPDRRPPAPLNLSGNAPLLPDLPRSAFARPTPLHLGVTTGSLIEPNGTKEITYTITERGLSAGPALESLSKWGRQLSKEFSVGIKRNNTHESQSKIKAFIYSSPP